MSEQFRRWKHCNEGSPNVTAYIDGVRLSSKLANGERANSRSGLQEYVAEQALRSRSYSSTGAVYGPTDISRSTFIELSIAELLPRVEKATAAAVHGRAIDAVPLVIAIATEEGVRVCMSATETDTQMPYDARVQPERFGSTATAGAMGVCNDTDYMLNGGGMSHCLQLPGGMHRRVAPCVLDQISPPPLPFFCLCMHVVFQPTPL
jgi:hypothetical protein